jgi:SNF2 family DNA or RNA helicase
LRNAFTGKVEERILELQRRKQDLAHKALAKTGLFAWKANGILILSRATSQAREAR